MPLFTPHTTSDAVSMRDTQHYVDFEHNFDSAFFDVAVDPSPTSMLGMQTSATTSAFPPQSLEDWNDNSIGAHAPHVFATPGNSGRSAVPQRGDPLDGIVEAIIKFLYRNCTSNVSVDAFQHVFMLCMERIRRDLVAPASITPIMNHGLSEPSDGPEITLSYPINPVNTSISFFLPASEDFPSHLGQMQVPSGQSLVDPLGHPHLPRGFGNHGQAVAAQQFSSSVTAHPPCSERQMGQSPTISSTQDPYYPTHLSHLPVTARRARRTRHETGPTTVCTQCNLQLSRDSLGRHIRERHEGKKRKASRKKTCRPLATSSQSAKDVPSSS